MASDEVSGKNEMTRSFHHPDLVGAGAAGEAAAVDAPPIGRLKKRKSTVDSQKSKGTGDGRKSGKAGENGRIGDSESKNILPHDYDRCQGKCKCKGLNGLREIQGDAENGGKCGTKN